MQSPPRFYIETLGCQMNALDSELVAGALYDLGYRPTAEPGQADLILINTCSVRAHAEQKAYAHLSHLIREKQRRPDLIIGVLGCMAQKQGHQVFDTAPHVDLVCGPGRLDRLPDLIRQARAGRQRLLAVSLDRDAAPRAQVRDSFVPFQPPRLHDPRDRPFMAHVRIMTGCDQFCSYCVVPTVRGPEQSLPPDHVVAEVCQLVDRGCRQVTLLGQTVNRYRYAHGPETTTRLPDLLQRVHDVAGIDRIKFITNFPRHMTDALIHAVRDLPKVCPYFHVPAQSGADAVLERMGRGYTVAEYRDMLLRIRDAIPDAAISSDFIVGFPGETEACFQQTVDLVREARFKNSFIFKYSPRPGTRASQRPDDVPPEEKARRHQILLNVHDDASLVANRHHVGQVVQVLVEGPSKREMKQPSAGPDIQLAGRTPTDHIVILTGRPDLAGHIISVRIHNTSALSLFGSRVPSGGPAEGCTA